MMEVDVIWYSDRLGYGFGIAQDGENVFLHRNVLSRSGFCNLLTGDKIECKLSSQKKGGYLVTSIFTWQSRPEPISAEEVKYKSAKWVDGFIKFYDKRKGYGFIGSFFLEDEFADIYFNDSATRFLDKTPFDDEKVSALIIETKGGYKALEVLPA